MFMKLWYIISIIIIIIIIINNYIDGKYWLFSGN